MIQDAGCRIEDNGYVMADVDETWRYSIYCIFDGFVKSRYCSLRDHLGAFPSVPLNFKNSAQAPQTA
ncbi:MAG: hypothetical protein R6W88_03460 [Desulfobacterales bacterium]